MCGIFGYANFLTEKTKDEISEVLINGIKRIEYRGYDSAGFCITDDSNKNFIKVKNVGKVNALKEKKDKLENIDMSKKTLNHVGIAHTRWATHGHPSETNCHPLSSDPANTFLVVHNGIITNYKELKQFLEKRKFVFESDTDTECAAKLALYFYNEMKKTDTKPEFVTIVKKVVRHCEGAFAFVFVSPIFPNEMVAVRKSSPLLIGLKTAGKLSFDYFGINFGTAKDDKPVSPLTSPNFSPLQSPRFGTGFDQNIEKVTKGVENVSLHSHKGEKVEIFLASDASALVEHTNKVIYLEDNDIAHVIAGSVNVYRPNSKAKETGPDVREIVTIDTELADIMKGNYPHYMIKEINEQSESVINTMRGRINFDTMTVSLGGLKQHLNDIKRSQRFVFIACGTSYHASLANRMLLEELLEKPVSIEIASDFLDRKTPVMRSDCVFFISQSGETADSVVALRYCLEQGALCVGITNTVGSTISRETECGVHINAGPEIGVASTKAYTSQYIALVLIALQLSEENLSKQKRRQEIMMGLKDISSNIQKALDMSDTINEVAQEMKDDTNMIVIGRGYQYATCMEGALKIKEITYIHSEGMVAGELKHGPIALVDENFRIILVVTNDGMIDKTRNAVEQINARKGKPLIICSEDIKNDFNSNKVLAVPKTIDCLQGIITVIPFQLLSYHLAVARGFNPDFPRNLAKSVTVE